jgi:hypothetical protein
MDRKLSRALPFGTQIATCGALEAAPDGRG